MKFGIVLILIGIAWCVGAYRKRTVEATPTATRRWHVGQPALAPTAPLIYSVDFHIPEPPDKPLRVMVDVKTTDADGDLAVTRYSLLVSEGLTVTLPATPGCHEAAQLRGEGRESAGLKCESKPARRKEQR
jgi:hypothetical protein